MTTQQKLEAITQDIRKKLPYLMELENGCSLKNHLLENKITGLRGQIVNKTPDNFYLVYWIDTDRYGNYSKIEFKNRFKVIGKEAMLSDVLAWFELKKDIFCLGSNGQILQIDNKLKIQYKNVIFWDLSKPFLKDQSEELINEIYYFLTKN